MWLKELNGTVAWSLMYGWLIPLFQYSARIETIV